MFLLAYISISSLLHVLYALNLLELKKMQAPHAVLAIIMDCGYVLRYYIRIGLSMSTSYLL